MTAGKSINGVVDGDFSFDEAVARLRAYIKDLTSDDVYSETFKDLEEHENKRHKEGLRLVVWELGRNTRPWQRELSAKTRMWPLRTRWYRFIPDEEVPSDTAIEWSGNTEFIAKKLSLVRGLCEKVLHSDEMEKLVRDPQSGLEWPDIIVADHFFSDQDLPSPEFGSLVNSLYHFVEPGGLFLTIESGNSSAGAAIADFMDQNGGRCGSSRAAQSVCSLLKQPNIYDRGTHKISDRKAIFNDVTCQEAVLRTLDRMDLPSGSRLLDVGVGDGRFSVHILDGSRRNNWIYHGLEMSSDPAMNPNPDVRPDLEGLRPLAKNFFAFSPEHHVGALSRNDPSFSQGYSAIFLFFVLHCFKHWQLYIYKAWQLLAPGGYLALSFRDDNFSFWLHGMFSDGFLSSVKDALQNYWDMRSRFGIRTFDQMWNVVSPTQSVGFAEELGFRVADVVRVSTARPYALRRSDFVPDPETGMATHWNIARVGVTKSDEQSLRHAFGPEMVEDVLNETMVVFILKKV